MRRRAGLLAGERLGVAGLIALRQRARVGTRPTGRAGLGEGERGRIAHAARALSGGRARVAIHQATGIGLEPREGRRRRYRGWRNRNGLLRVRLDDARERKANGKPQMHALLPPQT